MHVPKPLIFGTLSAGTRVESGRWTDNGRRWLVEGGGYRHEGEQKM
jgi:hypothetical protein